MLPPLREEAHGKHCGNDEEGDPEVRAAQAGRETDEREPSPHGRGGAQVVATLGFGTQGQSKR